MAEKRKLADLPDYPERASEIDAERREIAKKKAHLIQRRDDLKDEAVNLRVEKGALQKQYDKQRKESSKKLSETDSKKHLTAVLQDKDRPHRLDEVERLLENVLQAVHDLNDQIMELDRLDHALRKEHGRAMRAHSAEGLQIAWFEMLSYIDKASPLHEKFLEFLHNFQQLNRQFGNGLTYVQSLLQEFKTDAFLVDFCGNRLGEFARKGIHNTLYELYPYRHPLNPYHIERQAKSSGISGFNSRGR